MDLESLKSQLESLGVLAKLKKASAVYLLFVLKLLGVLLAGYIATRLLARVTSAIVKRLKLDELAERAGIQPLLSRIGLPAPSVFLPRVMRWLGFAATLYLAADILEIAILANAIGALIAYIPTLLTAIAIVLAGLLGAEFVKKLLAKVLGNKEGLNEVAEILPQGVFATIMVLTLAMAAQQLGLDISLINRIILFTVIGATLGIAGSLGLGASPLMKQLVGRYHALRLFDHDDIIELDGERLRLVRFAPLVAILEPEQSSHTPAESVERLFIPYHNLISTHIIRQRTTPEPETEL